MVERSSPDGRVRLVADEPRLAGLVAHGLLEDLPADRVRGAEPTGFRGRGHSVRLLVGDSKLIVKTLRRGGVVGRLLGASLGAQFRGARRLLDAVALAERLLEHGAATVRPAFARIRRGALPGFCRLEFASDELAGAVDAATYFSTRPAARARAQPRRAALHACGAAVHALHEAGVRHADLNLGNLLLADGRAFVIDLERSTEPRPLTPRDRVENLARLVRSAEKLGLIGASLSRSDLLRFLRAYEPGSRRELYLAVAKRHRSRAFWHRIAWRLFG